MIGIAIQAKRGLAAECTLVLASQALVEIKRIAETARPYFILDKQRHLSSIADLPVIKNGVMYKAGWVPDEAITKGIRPPIALGLEVHRDFTLLYFGTVWHERDLIATIDKDSGGQILQVATSTCTYCSSSAEVSYVGLWHCKSHFEPLETLVTTGRTVRTMQQVLDEMMTTEAV